MRRVKKGVAARIVPRRVWILFALLVGVLVLVIVSSPRALPFAVHTIRADDTMLRQVHALGATHLVQVFSWSEIQPSPERWDWEYVDWLVRAADYYNLKIIARLDKPPAWAVNDSNVLNSPPRDLNAYTNFVRRVAERYRGKIAAYIIWNEPNLAVEWGNQPPDARAYAELLRAASDAIRAADPNARVIAAALAPTNENDARAQDDRVFLRALYAAGARAAFDALGAHPYAFALPPDAPRDANYGLNFARLDDWRAVMAANGDAAKPIWITEFGYPTAQPPGYENRVVNETQQAEYLVRAYEQARDQMPFVEMFTVWNMARAVPPSDEQAGYSLVRADGSYTPAYDALRHLDKQPPIAKLQSLLTVHLPGSTFDVLARDTIVHLGDSEYPAPFVPLYGTRNPSVDWKGAFYLRDADLWGARATHAWTLYVELMQVNDFDSRVWVNDVPLMPPFLPVEDFTSKWVTAQFKIPAHALRVGDNAVSIRDGKLLPPFQQSGFTWDEFQFRSARVVPP
jgi:GH35 family endo-1,4-beta-xylanase